MSKIYSNNSTGYTGVSYETKTAKYKVYINVCGEKIGLGSFRSLEKAIESRKKAEYDYIKKFDEQDGFNIINFALQIKLGFKYSDEDYPLAYQKAYKGLLDAAVKYEGGSSFFSFAVKNIVYEMRNNRIKYASVRQAIPLVVEKWFNGETARSIARSENKDFKEVLKEIRKFTERIKIEYYENF